MVIPIFIPKRPTSYRKVQRKVIEVTGATCKVRTYVHFSSEERLNPKTLKIDYLEPQTYGFQVEVDLNKDEYSENKNQLEEYVCRKVKNEREFKIILEDCLKQHPDRDYRLDTFVPMEDIYAIDVHTVVHEYEDYVPL